MKGILQASDDETTECEHVTERDGGDHFVTPSGVWLCWECTGAFVSWMLDGGKEAEPDMWAWADVEDR